MRKFKDCTYSGYLICDCEPASKQYTTNLLHIHSAEVLPMQEGRELSQARLSPVMHLSKPLPCNVYPGSHL